MGKGATNTVKILLAAGAACIFIAANVSTFGVRPGRSGVWPIYHYYLNTKYFAELGYRSIYTCSLEAAGERWNSIEYVRDLETYGIVPRRQLPPCPRKNFSDARWESFTRDVATFASMAPPQFFAQAMSDKGFNPPPSWAVAVGAAAQHIPLGNPVASALVFNFDILLALAVVAIIWADRGYRAAMLACGLLLVFFGTLGVIGGNYAQYLWLPLLALAAYLWRRGKPGASGLAIGLAASLQVFPIIFALPVLAAALRRWRSTFKPTLRFGLGLAAAMLAALVVGSLSPRGVGAWVEWRQKIADHERYIKGEIFDIGLANLVATASSPATASANTYQQDQPHALQRNEALRQRIWIYYPALALLLALVGAVLWRTKERAPLWLAVPLMYGLLVLSPFYYLCLALLPYLASSAPPRIQRYVTWGVSLLLLAHLGCFGIGYISFGYLPHLVSELAIAAFVYGLALLGALRGGSESS